MIPYKAVQSHMLRGCRAAALLLRMTPVVALRPLAIGARPLQQQLRAPPALAVAVQGRGSAARMLCASAGPDRTVVDTCKAKISAALEPKEIEVKGAFDDPNGSHITVYCVAEAFEGKRSLARQQMVYKAIWAELEEERVHAVDTMVLKVRGTPPGTARASPVHQLGSDTLRACRRPRRCLDLLTCGRPSQPASDGAARGSDSCNDPMALPGDDPSRTAVATHRNRSCSRCRGRYLHEAVARGSASAPRGHACPGVWLRVVDVHCATTIRVSRYSGRVRAAG
jgi:acid stress-induced BolA-like protein IbaG/YrbA